MTGRVLHFESSAHRVVDALLPWYVNGTLDDDELKCVRLHLGECAQCRQESEWLRELHAACVASESDPHASLAFHKLRRRLEGGPIRGGLGTRPRRAKDRRNTWIPWAVAASLVVAVTLAAAVLRDVNTPALYRTLGDSSVRAPARASLIVVFDPATPEAELRRILREADARLVDGPTRTNAYLLEVPAERRRNAMGALRKERAVVLVERLGSEDRQ